MTAWNRLRKAKSSTKRLVKAGIADSITKKIEQHKSDPKKFWSTVHQVLGKSKTEVSRISIINEETGHLVEDHVLLMSLIVTTLMLEINWVRTLVFHGKRVTISLITSRFSFASVSTIEARR